MLGPWSIKHAHERCDAGGTLRRSFEGTGKAFERQLAHHADAAIHSFVTSCFLFPSPTAVALTAADSPESHWAL